MKTNKILNTVTAEEQETNKLRKLCSERKGSSTKNGWLAICLFYIRQTNVHYVYILPGSYVTATEIGINDFVTTAQSQVAVNTFQCNQLPCYIKTILKLQALIHIQERLISWKYLPISKFFVLGSRFPRKEPPKES